MYARLTTYQMNPERLEEALALADEIKPEIMAIDGIKVWLNLGNEDGSGAVLTVYESSEAAEAAEPQAMQIWGRFADMLTAPPNPQGYEVLRYERND